MLYDAAIKKICPQKFSNFIETDRIGSKCKAVLVIVAAHIQATSNTIHRHAWALLLVAVSTFMSDHFFVFCPFQELLLSSNDLEDLLERSDPKYREMIRTAMSVSGDFSLSSPVSANEPLVYACYPSTA